MYLKSTSQKFGGKARNREDDKERRKMLNGGTLCHMVLDNIIKLGYGDKS